MKIAKPNSDEQYEIDEQIFASFLDSATRPRRPRTSRHPVIATPDEEIDFGPDFE